MKRYIISILIGLLMLSFIVCGGKGGKDILASNAAEKVYVAPGDYDEIYYFMSGGFSGQITVYGIPSGRLIKQIPVFSQYPENGYGYDEETRAMLMTSHGFLPWDDSHHVEASQTAGKQDGRWIFINGNNTPRIARIGLESFETEEIIEIPNSAGNHASPFLTENTEYAMAATRFSVPIPQKAGSMEPGNLKGNITLIKIDPKTGHLSIDLQIMMPGFDYDLSHCGKGPSHDWCFFSSYNTERAWKMLEIEASRNDKDFIVALNWKKALECKSKAVPFGGNYTHNFHPENKPAVSEKLSGVKLLDPANCPGMVYLMPTPKSPHGVDVSPDGEYIVGGGKLAALIPVHSFSKLQKAIGDKSSVDKVIEGIPVLKYNATLAGEVQKPCLGPLHTEFDGNGYAYTSCFISSDVTKWKLGTWEVVQNIPTYYSIGHLSIVGGDSAKPYGKYLVAMNKITKDRYLPVGAELSQSAQLYDITGSKVQLLLDFPTIGEPHYAQGIPADLIRKKVQKIYKLEENKHPYAIRSEKDAKIVREGNTLHVYMTAIRSHFKPDIVEARKGDVVFFHVTNLEQDFDVPHGFAVFGNPMPNVLIMPGQTRTIRYDAKETGIYPFYCTDFCSALHQEMQQYIKVQ